MESEDYVVPNLSLMLLREIVLIATVDLIGVVTFGLVDEDNIFIWVFGAP